MNLIFASGVPPVVIPIAVAVGALLVLAVIVWSMYKVAEPNEALIISGLGVKGSHLNVADAEQKERMKTLGFKIVVGAGTLVLPVVQTVRSLNLDLRRINVDLEGVTQQSIPVRVRAVVIFKVADDYGSIANAARRFLGKQNDMDANVEELSHGQLRTIVGSMTVEELITDREALREKVLSACQDEMQKLGLHIDSFQIQEIRDVATRSGEPGYIENLGRPQAAEVAKAARIAEAEQTKLAASKEQEAEAEIAEATKNSEVRQADALAETQRAQAQAAQAGPLAEAQARKAVIEANTEAAVLEAQLTEKRLETEVRKPADARAYEQVTLANASKEAAIAEAQAEAETTKLHAEAQATATKQTGDAEAAATEATGLAAAKVTEEQGKAEAEGIRARSDALAANADQVIAEKVAAQLPELVRAAASQYENVEHLVVLDGADGLAKGVYGTIASIGPLLNAAKSLGKTTQDIAAGATAPAADETGAN